MKFVTKQSRRGPSVAEQMRLIKGKLINSHRYEETLDHIHMCNVLTYKDSMILRSHSPKHTCNHIDFFVPSFVSSGSVPFVVCQVLPIGDHL